MGNRNSSNSEVTSAKKYATYEQRIENYDRSFVEMEYRSLRAYFMNYEESELFDKRARRTEVFALCMGLVGTPSLGLFGIWRFQTTRSKLSVAACFAAPITLSLMAEYTARGSTPILPSLFERAHKHVQAGAAMGKIHKLATLYRSELLASPPDQVQWQEQTKRYNKLVEAYKKASEFSVIREETYEKHNTESVWKTYIKRSEQLDDYLRLKEEHRQKKTAGNKASTLSPEKD